MARDGFAARAVHGDATGIYGVASDTNAVNACINNLLYFGLARPVKLTPVSERYARLVCRTVRIVRSRGVAQPGRAPGSGPGGRRFKSSLPDQQS